MLGEFVATVAAGQAGGPDGEEPAGPDGGEPTAAAQADRVMASTASDTGDDACLVAIRLRALD